MSRRVEKYFPDVIKIVEDEFKNEISDKGIPSEYKGYISTFGAMIIQNGLIPTLAFFEKNDSNENKERKKIVSIIKKFLKDEKMPEKKLKSEEIEKQKLCQLLSQKVKNKDISKDELKEIENKILDISIVIKLSLRTFLEDK